MSGQTIVADPAFGVSIRTILDKDGRREIVFQMPVPLNVTDEQLNELMDKVYRAVDRQAARTELRELQETLEKYEETLPQYEKQYQEIAKRSEANFYSTGRKGSFDPDRHLQASERQSQKAIAEAISRDRMAIHKGRIRAAQLEALVNGHVSSGA